LQAGRYPLLLADGLFLPL